MQLPGWWRKLSEEQQATFLEQSSAVQERLIVKLNKANATIAELDQALQKFASIADRYGALTNAQNSRIFELQRENSQLVHLLNMADRGN